MSGESAQAPTFTSADRIRQLNDIDQVCSREYTISKRLKEILITELLQDVAKLIHSAGLAIQALTNTKPKTSTSTGPDGSVESHKTQFKEATQQYFALLSSIDVRLRRQVYALEEASVLAPESASRAGDSTGTGAGAAGAAAGAGASNPLDISWLNSRKDTVGKDKEAELWAAAREFMEKLEQSGTQQDSDKQNGESEKMQVD